MQEEANQKTVGIAVQGTKMTGRAFLKMILPKGVLCVID